MRVTGKPLSLLLAFLFAFPLTFVSASPVRAACYWSNSQTISTSRTPASGVTWTGRVTYQIGYNCSGNPVQILVASFRNSITFTNASPGAYHRDLDRAVLRWSDHTVFPPESSVAWYRNSPQPACTGSCTITRTEYPSVIIPYDSRASTWVHYQGCNAFGNLYCEIFYQFISRSVYIYP